MNPATCRSCGSTHLASVLDLGNLPLANGLVAAARQDLPDPRHPLHLVRCESCSLAQLRDTVPPEELFTHYAYFSSFSDTMLQHVRALVAGLVKTRSVGPQSTVVEVASNDGYLLREYKATGARLLGIEPARNIADEAERQGVPTLREFFNTEVAERLAHDGWRADIIHAHNVLAHVPDVNGFVRGLAILLGEDGVAVIEVPYVREMVDRCEFDTIYHEHVFYFSLSSLTALLARHGLVVDTVQRLPIHGGSLRILASRVPGRQKDGSVEALLSAEGAWVREPRYYDSFRERVVALKSVLRDVVLGLRARGKRIAGYGAAAKGAILLNYAGLGREAVDFVVDRSPHKQGLLMPGVRVPIEAPSVLVTKRPDYTLLLAWNLEAEVLAQQQEYRRLGGRFIVPVPDLKII